jgi:hypothetical protein
MNASTAANMPVNEMRAPTPLNKCVADFSEWGNGSVDDWITIETTFFPVNVTFVEFTRFWCRRCNLPRRFESDSAREQAASHGDTRELMKGEVE